MKPCFGYIRVSTSKQGEVSLPEQQSAIEAYAARHDLTIIQWFAEKRTAAKRGRRAFNEMLVELQRSRGTGVIFHKIDRSARNLRDWADLGELIDQGVECHFAHEAMDLQSRGGRLAADIQAVVAADFIRNLRDETRKGYYGRLKQGLYPLAAPYGYRDNGRGQPKTIDPVIGPLVRQGFELYSTGRFGLEQLRHELFRRGLQTGSGSPLSLNGISSILRNPFYVGIIRIGTTGETYAGVHEALVPARLFEHVQAVLDGRVFARPLSHDLLFRRLVLCLACGRSLTGEIQKGHVYYRCHGRSCRGTSARETDIDTLVREHLAAICLDEVELGDLRDILSEYATKDIGAARDAAAYVERDLARMQDKLLRLTDALVDGMLDKQAFNERRERLLAERAALLDRKREGNFESPWDRAWKLFERGNVALQQYNSADPDEKPEIVKSVGSNLLACGKHLEFPLYSPLRELKLARENGRCEQPQGQVRTDGSEPSGVRLSKAELARLVTKAATSSSGDTAEPVFCRLHEHSRKQLASEPWRAQA